MDLFGVDAIAVIAIVAALIAVIIAIYAAVISRRTLHHQALLDVHKDFRSGEMLSALNEVWAFYRKCENNYKNTYPKTNLKTHLKREYENKISTENALVSNGQMKIEDTLSYKRRLITHFYIHLASIYKHGILPPEMIFDWWIASDFVIFEEIIFPLQMASSKIHKVDKDETEYVLDSLRKLEKDGRFFYDNREKRLKKFIYFRLKIGNK